MKGIRAVTRTDHSEIAHELNIAAIHTQTRALGPGTRAAIWVQGCPLHCQGCIAPHWIPFIPAMKYTPEQVVERLDLDAIEGITFSGGEPIEQAAGLAKVIQLARQRRELDLICFTGYRYERLVTDPPNQGVRDLLQQVDVLIDGPYIQALNDSVGLRGSSNQRVIHLTSRLRHYDFESSSRRVEINITNGELGFIGIPTPQITSALQRIPFSG